MGDAAGDAPGLHVFDTVRCLDCGEAYAKPRDGGTVAQNPGCPACGYVGWLPVSLPPARRRSDADQLRRRRGRSR
jgi:hypothetical protein